MEKIVECACGYQARAAHEDDLVRDLQEHARRVHQMEMTREQVLAIARPADEG